MIKPSSMEDTREIADTLVDNSTVILNLEGIDVELAQRIIDFTSGACYSLGGSLQKVMPATFLFWDRLMWTLRGVAGAEYPWRICSVCKSRILIYYGKR